MFLTSSSFLYLALCTLPLACIYFWRRRYAKKTVAAIFLWDIQKRPPQQGNSLQVNRLPLAFFLEALTVILLAIAAASPFLMQKSDMPPLTIILDNSFSMQAIQEDGKSARECVEPTVKKRLSTAKGRQVNWILAGPSPEKLDENTTGSPFASWKCDTVDADLPTAIAFARQHSPNSEIFVATDHKPDFELGGDVSWEAHASPRGNMAIVNLRRDSRKILVEVQNASAAPSETRLAINNRFSAQETFKPNETRRFIFDLLPEEREAPVKITIADTKDAIDYDNTADSLPENRTPLSYRFMEDLTAKQLSILNKTLNPNQEYIAVGTRELCIGRDNIPTGDYNRLFWHTGTQTTKAGTITLRPGYEELFRGLSWSELQWPADSSIEMRGEVLAWQGDIPVISIVKRGRFFDIHMNLNESTGNLTRSPFWPSFFWNLSDFLRSRRPGPAQGNIRSNDVLTIRTSEPHEAVAVDGNKTLQAENYLTSTTLSSPGIHTVKLKGSEHKVAVTILAPEESNLKNAAKCSIAPTKNFSSMAHTHKTDLAPLFFLAAIATLCLHWFCCVRKNGSLTKFVGK